MSSIRLPPSKLGTKAHWDQVYQDEIQNFNDDEDDEGEIWFGKDSVNKMVSWSLEHVQPASTLAILEIGIGNGTLLFALAEAGYDTATLHGIDYSPSSITLATSIAQKRDLHGIQLDVSDFLAGDPPKPTQASDEATAVWDLILDKGTHDAIALMNDVDGQSPAAIYPSRVAKILKPGGFFLITACNFTEEELKLIFATAETGLQYHSRVQHRVHTFGGKTGSVCATVAFQKPR